MNFRVSSPLSAQIYTSVFACASIWRERRIRPWPGPMIFQQEQYVPSKEKCRHVSEPLPILLEPGTRDGTEIVFKAREHRAL